MKFIGFAATYSPEDNEITNKHNFFMNGILKDDVSESSYEEVCDISQNRNLYALADASKSLGKGENAAFLCMDMMSNLLGADFDTEQGEYFYSANDVVKGRSFQENGLDMAVDMGVLYISGGWAKAYNVGDVSIFYCNKGKLNKISGEMPELVEVEEVLKEDKEVKIEKKLKRNIPHIGYFSEDFGLVPYVSPKIKIENTGAFVMATKSVTALVSEDDILSVLNDKNIADEDKTSAIISLAVEKNPDGNYTIELIKAKEPKRIAGIRADLIALAIVLVLGTAGIFVFPYIQSAGNSVGQAFTEFIMKFMYGSKDDKSDVTVEPWVPMVDKEDEKEDEKEPETNEAENDDKAVENPPITQKPAVVQTKPVNPVAKPGGTQNVNANDETESIPKEEAPVSSPSLENTDVELPIDFD